MVGAVVPTPLIEVVLQSEHVTEREEEAHALVGLVGAMGEEAVGATLDAQRGEEGEEKGEVEGPSGDHWQGEEDGVEGEGVQGRHDEDIAPNDFTAVGNG